MPRAIVILPSTTYRASDFIRAAEGLGIDLVVASENPPPVAMGDDYVQIDCSDPNEAADALVRLSDESVIDGIVAADDAGVVTAALAGTKLGLPANPPDAAAATRNKFAMRERLSSTETPQPSYSLVGADDDPVEAASSLGLPLVIKPLDRSASQGVIRIDDAREASDATARVRSIVGDERAPVLMESFIGGKEVAVEGLITAGRLEVLAIFDKPDTREGPYFPETMFVTPSRLDAPTQDECFRVAQMAVQGLELVAGPVHIELKVTEDRIWVLEVAARSIGGLCSRSLNFGLMGTSLEALLLRNAIGVPKPELRREHVASGVLMVPIPNSGRLVEVSGLSDLSAIEHVTGYDVTAHEGDHLLAPPEGDRYVAFVYARAETAIEVERALREAMRTVEVRVS